MTPWGRPGEVLQVLADGGPYSKAPVRAHVWCGQTLLTMPSDGNRLPSSRCRCIMLWSTGTSLQCANSAVFFCCPQITQLALAVSYGTTDHVSDTRIGKDQLLLVSRARLPVL